MAEPVAPLFGVPPQIRALLTGAPLYGRTIVRDLYCATAYHYPPLVTGDHDDLLLLCGGDHVMARLLRSLWKALASAMERAVDGHDEVLVTQLYTVWSKLCDLLDGRRATEIELDLWSGGCDALDDIRDRLTFVLAKTGEVEAIDALLELLKRHARTFPGEGHEALYGALLGAELLDGTVRHELLMHRGLIDPLAQWREHGTRMLAQLASQARPEAKPAITAPMALGRVQEARRQPVDDGPSLLVLESVEHLPGGAKNGSDKSGSLTGSTPRTEWAPFAGRRWPLARVGDLAVARAVLVGEFPYAERIIDAVLRDLAGRPHVHVRPLLLVGPPGSGKTRLARRIAEVLGVGYQVYNASGAADASFLSTSRQWSTGRASIPLQLLKRLAAASGLIILDELDKVGTGTQNGSLLDALLPLLTDDAKRHFDTFVEAQVDLSGVCYIATANDVAGLRRSHPALVDRFRVYEMPAPRREDLPVLLRGVMREIRAERGLDEHWLPDLDGEEAELVAAHFQEGSSVRLVRRLAETVLASREHLATRM